MTAHVAKWKKDKVEEIKKLINQYKIVAIADMTNMPSPQLQKMRSSLRGNMRIIMTKARLMKLAIRELKDTKKGIEQLEESLKGMPSLVLTQENPFRLSKLLSKSKTKAPAKPGQLAPNDIKISAGPTPFAPGPVMGELGQLGIKTTVQEGKIHIKDDVIIVKEGAVISDKVASMLSKLKIEPMEIGLNLIAAYEDGLIYKKDVLSIDDTMYLNNVRMAYSQSINLAMNIDYPTKDTISLMVKKAYLDGKALLNVANIEIPEVKEEVKQEIKEEQKKMKEPKSEQEIFEEDQKKAQAVLNRLQEEKMKHPAPIYVKKDMEIIKKGPDVKDLVPKDNI